MYNVAIIGAGQLGSRHLQGLKKARMEMSIQVVDSSPTSLNLAKSRYEEVDENPNIYRIEYISTIELLVDSIDLVIVATGSMPRAEIIKTLLLHKKVKNLILEKFLFPSLGQYSEVEAILREAGILKSTWVNCPRRMFSYYEQLKGHLSKDILVYMKVWGTNWGLACNAVHFIDIMSYLIDQNDWNFSVYPDSKIINSRRSGYIEVEGIVTAFTLRGDMIVLEDRSDYKGVLTIEITTSDGLKININEENGIMTMNGIEESIEIKYQSELTNLIAEDILLNHSCRLTPYLESSLFHKAFLEQLILLYSAQKGGNINNCPIT